MVRKCEPFSTTLTCEEALVLLEPHLQEFLEEFIEYEREVFGSSRLKTLRMECDSEMRDTPRHFAGAREDGKVICVAPELAALPDGTARAILAHELGHALDFSYPGQWVLVDDEIQMRAFEHNPKDKRNDQAKLAAVRQWNRRDEYVIEATADALAEVVTGQSIGYGGPCMLQRFDSGIPRPKLLR